MRELRDELEVPGHVNLIRMMTVKEITDKLRAIVAKHEGQGAKKLSEIPEGADKQEMRELCRAIGLQVRF
jgi:hypothetical protein